MFLDSKCKINIPADLPEELRFAVRALANDLFKVFGIMPQISENADQPDIIIHSGSGEEETFSICSTAENIVISGDSPLGTVFGIYHFCEKSSGSIRFISGAILKLNAKRKLTPVFSLFSLRYRRSDSAAGLSTAKTA